MSIAGIGAAVAGAAVSGGIAAATSGGGGGGGENSSSSTSQYLLSPQQQQIFDRIWPRISGLAKNKQTWKPYSGQTLAGVTGAQQQAQNEYLAAADSLSGLGAGVRDTLLGLPGAVQGNYASLPGQATQTGEALLENALLGQETLQGDTSAIYDQLYSTIGGTQNRLLNASDVRNNPALSGAIDAAVSPLSYNFANVVMPSIRSRGVATGLPGSSREGVATANAIQNYQTQVGNVAAGMANQAYQAGLGAEGQAVANLGTIAGQEANARLTGTTTGAQLVQQALQSAFGNQLGVADAFSQSQINAANVLGQNTGNIVTAATAPATIREGVGQQQQAQQQAILNDTAQRYYAKTQFPLQVAQQFLSMIGQLPGGTTQSTATGPMPYTSPINAGIGGGLLGLQLANAFSKPTPQGGTGQVTPSLGGNSTGGFAPASMFPSLR